MSDTPKQPEAADRLAKVIARAAADGLMARSARGRGGDGEEKPEAGLAVDEPLAEWERDLLPGGTDGASIGAGSSETVAAGSAPSSTSNGTPQS